MPRELRSCITRFGGQNKTGPEVSGLALERPAPRSATTWCMEKLPWKAETLALPITWTDGWRATLSIPERATSRLRRARKEQSIEASYCPSRQKISVARREVANPTWAPGSPTGQKTKIEWSSDRITRQAQHMTFAAWC